MLFKNNKLDLSKIENQMFQKILKKYLFINIFKLVNNNNNNNKKFYSERSKISTFSGGVVGYFK